MTSRRVTGLILPLLACLLMAARACGGTIDAITFAAEPEKLFLPVNEAVDELKWPVARDEAGRILQLNLLEVQPGKLRTLTDGTELVSTALLAAAGAEVLPPDEDGRVKVGGWVRGFTLKAGVQRVVVSLKRQVLEGWQGDRLVVQTHISSGRNGRTPAGEFHAGPFRTAMHYSSLFQNAPMPWSVQINGNIFIHGFTSVPDYPASHGCIRVPLTNGNPAKFFYEWVLNGTPVSVTKD